MRPDRGASLAEAWRTLEALVDEGKIRALGVSNYGIEELEELLSYARIPPAVLQVESHPKLPQAELLAYCRSKQIAVTAYSPLGRGTVKGTALLASPVVTRIARHHEVSAASVILRWNVQRGVAVIPKSVTPSRIVSNAQEPLRFQLDAAEVEALGALADGTRYCNSPWATSWPRSWGQRAASAMITAMASLLFVVFKLDITRY